MNDRAAQTPATSTPAVCLGCTLCCDDVRVELRDGRYQNSLNVCELGRHWFQNQAEASGDPRANFCRVAGREASLEQALAAASELLAKAKNPLVCGLAHLSTAEQQAMVQIAQRLRAQLDIDWWPSARGNLAALQVVGRVTATLGQVNLQSSGFLLIESAPELTHPRIAERMGWLRQRGWRIRTAELEVGQLPETSHGPVRELVCETAEQLGELVWLIRSRISGLGAPLPDCPPGWHALAEEIAAAAGTASGLTLLGGGRLDAQPDLALGVHQLARELNELCKAWLLLASGERNRAGAESVLTWSTGFPQAVNLQRETPVWNRQEYSAARLLEQSQIDCLLAAVPAIDSGQGQQLPLSVQTPLEGLDRIVFHAGEHPLVEGANVSIPISQVGWDLAGDVTRLDELVLTAPRVVSGQRLGLVDLLRRLEEGLG